MATKELQFLLLGKTGHGKSATGNLLLDQRFFKQSTAATSVTKDVRNGVAEFQGHKLNVVDGPGLEDTDLNPVDDKLSAMTNVEKSLALCYGGVDAFLFVYRYGSRFTDEERSALEGLKQIFGDMFMEHVIVVVTGEDLLEKAIGDGEYDSFEQYCQKQTGAFREVCKDCKGRVVIIDNSEKDKLKRHKYILQIVQFADTLHASKGRYTSDCFKKAERKREKLILEKKAPILKKKFQEKICLLNIDILKLTQESSNRNNANLKVRIQELRNEIEKHDRGVGVLNELSVQINQLENCLQDTVKLKEIAENLEYVRNAKNTWTNFGQDRTNLGAGLAFAAVGGLTAIATIVTEETKQKDERAAAEQKLSKLKFGQEHGEPAGQDVKKKRTDIAQTQLEKDKNKQNNLLLGRTRQDKSSTGNTIYREHRTSSNIAYFLLRCVSPVLCIAVIVLTVSLLSSNTAVSGTSQDDSQSEICIKYDVDKKENQKHFSEAHQLLGKLVKKMENGRLKYCSETTEQMQAMLELVSVLRKENAKEKSSGSPKGFSFTPVSVHKQLFQSPRDKEVNEPTVINDHNIPMLISNNESSIEHVRGVDVTNDSLVIRHTGLYFVYAGVYFRPVSDRPAGEFEHQSWFMYIHRTCPDNPQLTGTILQIGHTVCKECRDNQETAFTGGNFYLKEGDTIQVCYSYLGVVKFIKESTFVGLIMLESGSN